MDSGRIIPSPPLTSSVALSSPRRKTSGLRGSWRRTAATLLILACTLSACGPSVFSGQDVRVEPTGDTLYIHTRSDGVSRNFCAGLGGDVARTEGRWAAAEGKTIRLGRLEGCHTIRHVIVCPEGDAGCLAHEERHKREGAFHP